MMQLNEANDVGAKHLDADLPIDRVIHNGRKNPQLCNVDCIGCFIAYFNVQLLCFFLLYFEEFQKLLEKIFLMALVPLF